MPTLHEIPYFRDHRPAADETIRLTKPSAHQIAFVDMVLHVIGEVAARWGYGRTWVEVGADHAQVDFVKADHLIRITASTHYLDAPSYYNLVLGLRDGDTWRSIALWRIQRELAGNEEAREYAFPMDAALAGSLAAAAADLEQAGRAFLEGDTTVFQAAWKRMVNG